VKPLQALNNYQQRVTVFLCGLKVDIFQYLVDYQTQKVRQTFEIENYEILQSK